MSECKTDIKEVESPTLLEELTRIWRELPDKKLFGALVIAWLGMFCYLGNSTFGYIDTPSLLNWMYIAYNSPGSGDVGVGVAAISDDGYGILVPFIVLFVLWGKRDEFLALPRRPWAPAMGLLLFAVLIHLLGYAVQQPRVSIVALFVGLYSLVGIVWGFQWLKAAFMPFTLFVFCEPMSTLEIIKPFTIFLQVEASNISTWIAHSVLGFAIQQKGVIISSLSGLGKYEITEGCSGIHSLISLFVLMTAFGLITYRSPWRRLALTLMSVPMALLCNVLRIVSVITAGEVFGRHASDTVHEWSGYFTYALAIGCMLALSNWWTEKPPQDTASPSDP